MELTAAGSPCSSCSCEPRRVPRTLIAERIWEAHYDMETNLIDVYVRRLRQKLGATEDQPLIRTVRGTGYQFI